MSEENKEENKGENKEENKTEEKKSDDSKKITMEQLGEHKTSGDLWLLVDGQVYDLSKFMDEHPGGDEVLMSEAGKDATEAFEDVGHSDDARALLPNMLVGALEGAVQKTKKATSEVNQVAQKSGNPILMFIPLMLLGVWVAYRNFA